MNLPVLFKKSILFFVIATLVCITAFHFASAYISKQKAIAHLDRITDDVKGTVVPYLENLVGSAVSESVECSERSPSVGSFTTRTLWCRKSLRFQHSPNAVSESMRAEIEAKAKVLDEFLSANGWKPSRADKPSITAIIPDQPLEAFHSETITFRKEKENVKCLLSISFQGPTNESSPGIVNVGDFSCMHETKFFSLHIPHFTRQGFTPI